MSRNPYSLKLNQLSMQIVQLSGLHGLHGLAVFFDEIRALSATAEEVHAAMERFGSAIAVHIPYDLRTIQFKTDFSDIPKITCDCCCHCQAHPPRCQLSKRSISPKQFSCKKYSPKHNPRK